MIAKALEANKDVVEPDTIWYALKSDLSNTNKHLLIRQHKHLITKIYNSLLDMEIDKKKDNLRASLPS